LFRLLFAQKPVCFQATRYVVAPQKRIGVGHYAFTLLFAVRLVPLAFCEKPVCFQVTRYINAPRKRLCGNVPPK